MALRSMGAIRRKCKGPCGLECFVLASLNGPGEEGKLAI